MMSRIVHVPKGFEYHDVQHIEQVVVYYHYGRPPNKKYEFCIERFCTTYRFLLRLIALKLKVDLRCFDVKLNGWQEVIYLRHTILDRRFVSIYFITNNRYRQVQSI